MSRYARFIVLLLCLAASVKLVALWARSYKLSEQWPGPICGRWTCLLASKQGHVVALLLKPHGAPGWWHKQHRTCPVDDELSFPGGDMRQYGRAIGFGWIRDPHYSVMRSTQTLPDGRHITFFGAASATLRGAGPVIPYWFMVLLVLGLGGMVWTKWPPRFSLRGMFVAMSVVATVLALALRLGR